jgi:orc1/cdc6 family replication initiation protein
MSSDDAPIIINEEALTEAFIPTRLLHREGQIRELERCLKPALKNRSIENIFLMGTSGTGKTTITKWILEDYFKEVSAYINCWKYRTTHEVLKEILLELQIPVHGREPTSELTKTLEKVLKKRKIIVCLDEVDRLDDFDLLYLLARSSCGLILISTRCHVLANLTTRIRSSLALTEIEFPPYRTDELYDIIRDRVEYAFRPCSLRNEFIKLASVAAQGDARAGLEIVRKAGKKAEIRYSNEVTMREIEETINEMNKLKKIYPFDKLNEHQKVIYKILEKNRKMQSGLLYNEYRSLVNSPVVDRAYRNYMRRLVNLGLIKSEGKGRWKIYELPA